MTQSSHLKKVKAPYQTTGKRKEEGSLMPLGNLALGKVTPQAKELEDAILGAVLLEREALDRISDILKPECFYQEKNRIIYRTIINMSVIGTPVDVLTVVQALMKSGELDAVGGPYGVTVLTNQVVSSANIEHHAKVVYQKFLRRKLIEISGSIIQSAYDEECDEFDLLETSEKLILELGTNHISGKTVTLDTATVEAMKKIVELRDQGKHITGVPSGYPMIDKATRGFQDGNFIVIAARPSVGKTAFALNLVRNAAVNEHKPVPVAVWSLEMDYLELVLRMMAAESEVMLSKIQTGRLTDDDLKLIHHKMASLAAEAKIFFDDGDGLTIASFKSKARRLKKKHNIGLIMVDYLQLMSSGEGDRSVREQEISKISRACKSLARELKIPVIALSQLSREVEKRKDPVPQLSDIRESGSIEQDADIVMFLYGPPDDKIQEDASLKYRKYVKIAKHRNGVLLTQDFDFKSDIQLFRAIDDLLPSQPGNWKQLSQVEPPKNYYEPEKNEDLPF